MAESIKPWDPGVIDDGPTDTAPPANTSVIIPKTRTEHFLAKIAGDPNAKELTPRTRREYFLNEIAENGGSGGGSSNLVFDLANAKHPEIDGVEYDYVYAYYRGQDAKLTNVFVCDFNNYPPIISKIGAQGIEFTMVTSASSLLYFAGRESDSGDLQPLLLEDAECIKLSTANGNYLIFPTTAKFGLRKAEDK